MLKKLWGNVLIILMLIFCFLSQMTVKVSATAILKIVKTVDNKTTYPGATMRFTYVVTNMGMTDIRNVTVLESLIDENSLTPNSVDILTPGQCTTFTATLTIPSTTPAGVLSNSAVATGTYGNNLTIRTLPCSLTFVVENNGQSGIQTPNNNPVNNNQNSNIRVISTVNNENPNTGDIVIYNVTVSNIGAVALNNISVTDNQGFNTVINRLELGQSSQINIQRTVVETSGSFTNIVNVYVPNGPSASDNVTYTICTTPTIPTIPTTPTIPTIPTIPTTPVIPTIPSLPRTGEKCTYSLFEYLFNLK